MRYSTELHFAVSVISPKIPPVCPVKMHRYQHTYTNNKDYLTPRAQGSPLSGFLHSALFHDGLVRDLLRLAGNPGPRS
jgi:hypothetical protein